MFDPVLEHNRAEYDRLGRVKVKAFVTALLCIPLLTLAVVAMAANNAPDYTIEYLIIASLIALGIVLGTIEIKRAMVYRRDLLERQSSESKTADEGE